MNDPLQSPRASSLNDFKVQEAEVRGKCPGLMSATLMTPSTLAMRADDGRFKGCAEAAYRNPAQAHLNVALCDRVMEDALQEQSREQVAAEQPRGKKVQHDRVGH